MTISLRGSLKIKTIKREREKKGKCKLWWYHPLYRLLPHRVRFTRPLIYTDYGAPPRRKANTVPPSLLFHTYVAPTRRREATSIPID